jgi:NAD(P)-dependent dehydrogenase (short-subunit alcohol dehydrogenase family)
MGTLDGKVAIVTGAGRGLGRAHSMLLAAEGARVVVNDLGDEADDVVAEITGAGGEAVANHSSVADWKGAKELIDQAVDEFGDLHVLVNNAGILRDKMSFNMEEDEWDSVISVHLKGHFCPSRHAGNYWRSQTKAGNDAPRRIINTSSEAGLFGNAGQANYAAAKAGIATLAIVFGRELASYGVTGNAIAPRARTRMTDQFDFFQPPEEEAEFDRFLPENVSPVVAWLATDEASDVNGQVFVVIGGDVWVLQGWTIAGHLHKDGPWTIDELASKKDELFADHDRGLPGMAVPSW